MNGKILIHICTYCVGLVVSASGLAIALPAFAQDHDVLLQQDAQLKPAHNEYTFAGTAGQAIKIRMTSPQLDSSLVLLSPTGEQIAMNDDFYRGLDATIVTTLPVDGTYTVWAQSYSPEQSGTYELTVSNATPYDVAFYDGYMAYLSGDYATAIAAYERAIAADPTQPEVYLVRADALYSLAQQLLPDERSAILDNYRHALELYEQSGDADAAQQIRDQMGFLESQP